MHTCTSSVRPRSPLVLAGACLTLLTAPALAQTPFVPRAEIWVTDSNNDRITRVRDLNFDGDYNDVGESSVFYSDLLGVFPLSNNVNIESTRDGALWVSETNADQILVLRDLDNNGTAHGSNEAAIFFQAGVNAAALAMPAPQGLHWSGSVLWIANTQSGSSGKDTILRLEDLNNDDDALDTGEALEFYVSDDLSQGGNTNDSSPQDVQVGPDGALYYLDIASSGALAKGLYRLEDLDSSGVIDAPNEVTAFFIPPPQTANAFFWNVSLDAQGYWYLADTGNDFIWRARDANGDGVISPSSEATKYWTSPASSLIWDLRVAADGALYAGESQSSERFFVMRDLDGSGEIDQPNEVEVVFDELLALGDAIGQLRGWCFDTKQQNPAHSYCTAQLNTLGCAASYSFAGWPSASQTSGFLLTVSNLRNQKTGVPFYGLSGPASAPFNGGTLCVQPPVTRIAVLTSGGSPSGDDCSGSVTYDFNARIALGLDPGLVLGAVVHTQHWSRDPGAAPTNTNLSNALEFCILR